MHHVPKESTINKRCIFYQKYVNIILNNNGWYKVHKFTGALG